MPTSHNNSLVSAVLLFVASNNGNCKKMVRIAASLFKEVGDVVYISYRVGER